MGAKNGSIDNEYLEFIKEFKIALEEKIDHEYEEARKFGLENALELLQDLVEVYDIKI